MSEIKITIRPDGTMQIHVEDPDDRTCEQTERVLLAAFAQLGCGVDEGSEEKRVAVPEQAVKPRVRGR